MDEKACKMCLAALLEESRMGLAGSFYRDERFAWAHVICKFSGLRR